MKSTQARQHQTISASDLDQSEASARWQSVTADMGRLHEAERSTQKRFASSEPADCSSRNPDRTHYAIPAAIQEFVDQQEAPFTIPALAEWLSIPPQKVTRDFLTIVGWHLRCAGCDRIEYRPRYSKTPVKAWITPRVGELLRREGRLPPPHEPSPEYQPLPVIEGVDRLPPGQQAETENPCDRTPAGEQGQQTAKQAHPGLIARCCSAQVDSCPFSALPKFVKKLIVIAFSNKRKGG